jgi:hypothetical protein
MSDKREYTILYRANPAPEQPSAEAALAEVQRETAGERAIADGWHKRWKAAEAALADLGAAVRNATRLEVKALDRAEKAEAALTEAQKRIAELTALLERRGEAIFGRDGD